MSDPVAKVPLDVRFVGGRDYIQGSLLTRLGIEAARRTLPDLSSSVRLTEAKFTHILRCGANAHISRPGAAAPAGSLGVIELMDDGAGAVTVHFSADEARVAPRVPDDFNPDLDVVSDAPFCGRGRFVMAGDFDNFLLTVVEAVKRIHQNAADKVADVWFCGLRDCDLPVSGSYPTEGTIIVENRLLRSQGERTLTLSQASFGHDRDRLNLTVVFSCRVL